MNTIEKNEKILASDEASSEGNMDELIDGLSSLDLSTRQKAIMRIMGKGPRELRAIEEAIKRLTGKQDIKFYEPYSRPSQSSAKAYEQILRLAREGRLLDDLALVQSLFESVDLAYKGSDIARELKHIVDAKTFAVFQLLASQLALAERNPKR
jgi:hypothetical protein